MKKTLKIMLAALLSLAMVLTFAGAADLEAPVTATALADDLAIDIHAADGALDAFIDAPEMGNWSYEALNCIVANELMKGNGNKMMPANLLSRAEMTTIMVRVLGAENLSADISSYIDVKRGEWFYDAISSGVATKIINGNGNKMMPKDSITREQAMAILARTFLFEAETNATATFKDKAKVSYWALESANALVERKIVLGDSNGNLRPQDNITRAEFATMLHRIVCYFAKTDVDYAGKTINGSVILDDGSIDLSGVTIDGDLYIVEGVGNAKIDLTDVTVTGNIVIRGGDVTVAEGASVIRPEVKPEVVPPVVDKDDTTDRETPNVATTPNGADVTPVEIDENGTYVSYNNGATKVYADVTGKTITFDLTGVAGEEVLKDLFVKANKNVSIKADGFSEVNFKTNEEFPVAELLADMLDSTNKAISNMMGITNASGEVEGDLKLSYLADKVETAYIFYTNDTSDDKWMQKLFDDRDIICDEAINKAAFKGTIGGNEYTIVIIVPEN
ncbi:MAG: S-layer homology domain-containing protein [Oscillospiraceae bacterium]|nr:S-layer homology domain-containing protein [Oscillospiraceae bacterium]